jgi:hypothetical protein
MKKILVLFLLILPLIGVAQSFVFCPHIDVDKKTVLKNATIALVFKDSRIYEKKLKEQCYKDQIFSEFANCIKRTYPKIQLIILDESKFPDQPDSGILTIKVDFKQFEATYMPGSYHGKTIIDVGLFDYRTGDTVIQSTIRGEGKAANMVGYTSGMNATNKSFKMAFDSFIQLVDQYAASSPNQNFVRTEPTQKSPGKSKFDRLKELKQLLDENILTREEYEKEKKKILDEDPHL